MANLQVECRSLFKEHAFTTEGSQDGKRSDLSAQEMGLSNLFVSKIRLFIIVYSREKQLVAKKAYIYNIYIYMQYLSFRFFR